MPENTLPRVNLTARIGLAFVFIYHGLVPKIIWLSPIEAHLTNLHGIGIPAGILSPIAGAFEIGLGVSIILIKKSLIPVYAAAVLLVVLLADAALLMPSLLIEAFNPVSINIASLVLCYLIQQTHRATAQENISTRKT